MTGSAPAVSLRWWDLATGLIIVVTGVLGIAEALEGSPLWAAHHDITVRLAINLWPIAAVLMLYVALGRGALRRAGIEDPRSTRDGAFLALLLLVLIAAVASIPMYALLQTLAYPMAWTVARRYRDALLWSAGIALATGIGLVLSIGAQSLSAALVSATLTASLSFVFAAAMGTWITRIAEQGERYRALVDDLRVSQAEVAELSKAAGATAERERLSRELHDTLTQTLTGLVMLSEQTERALSSGDMIHARERLGRVHSAARDALTEARALVASTHPLGDGGLHAAIERVALRFAEDTGIMVTRELDPVALDREREVVMLRAAQEGLANARKHSRAERIRIVLGTVSNRETLLIVEDDGIGVDPEAMERGGFGLSGLADRVRTVGGTVHFGPGERHGSTLEVRLSIPEEHP